jgi:hypothetical protein
MTTDAQSQQQQSPRRQRANPPANGGRRETVDDWQRDWRNDVRDSIRQIADTQQQMALLIADHNSRIKVLEEEPKEQRAIVNSASARNSWFIMLCALALSILSVAAQHISFH